MDLVTPAFICVLCGCSFLRQRSHSEGFHKECINNVRGSRVYRGIDYEIAGQEGPGLYVTKSWRLSLLVQLTNCDPSSFSTRPKKFRRGFRTLHLITFPVSASGLGGGGGHVR